MNWFSRKQEYSVCIECKVHFEPATEMEAIRWPYLCPTHRKLVMERELRIDKVVRWARENWEKIEPVALEEERLNQARFSQAIGDLAERQRLAANRGLQGGGLAAHSGLPRSFPGGIG